MAHILMENKLVPGREEELLDAAIDRLIIAVKDFSRVDPNWRAKLYQSLPPHSEPWEYVIAEIAPDTPAKPVDEDASEDAGAA